MVNNKGLEYLYIYHRIRVWHLYTIYHKYHIVRVWHIHVMKYYTIIKML